MSTASASTTPTTEQQKCMDVDRTPCVDDATAGYSTHRPLMKHQTEALHRLCGVSSSSRGAILAMPTGTGKTAVALAFARARASTLSFGDNELLDCATLFVTTRQVVRHVYAESALMYGLSATRSLRVISIGEFVGMGMSPHIHRRYHTIVLDEYKTSPGTCKALSSVECSFVLLVSATPGTRYDRREAYIRLLGAGRGDNTRRLDDDMLVKVDVVRDGEWTPPQSMINVTLTPNQRTTYKSMIKEYKSPGHPSTTRMQQLRNILCFLAHAKLKEAALIVTRSIKAANGHVKIVILSTYPNVLTQLRLDLPTWVNVSTCPETFMTDDTVHVLVGTIGRLGKGVDLPCANGLLLLDVPWSASVQKQSIGRITRIGCVPNQKIGQMLCTDTIEERLMTMHDNADVTALLEELNLA